MAWITHLLLSFSLLTAYLGKVTELIQICKHYPNPKNGHVVCDSLFRLFCTPECDDGFVFESRPAVVYMCGPLTGEWFTYPEGEEVPWPDCIRREGFNASHKEDDVASRREQIAQKIHNTHSALFPQKNQLRSDQIGQPDARYLHLFSYIQRAQQVYHNKQANFLAYNALERQRQVELEQQKQQQRQRQLQMQQQLQRRKQKQKSMQQAQRPVRHTIEFSIKGQQHNVAESLLPTPFWRDVAYHIPRNSQSNREIASQPTFSGSPAFSYYRKVPQVPYERFYSPFTALQRKYVESHSPKRGFAQRQSHPDITSRSAVPLKQTGFVQSLQSQSQVKEKNRTPLNWNERQVSLIAVSVVAKPTLQRSPLSRMLPNSGQDVHKLQYKLNSQTEPDTEKAVRVNYNPINNIAVSNGGINLSNRSWTILSKPTSSVSTRSQLQVGHQSNASLKSGPAKTVSKKTAETQVKPAFLVKPIAKYAVQTGRESQPAPNLISNPFLNTSFNAQGQSNMKDWQNNRSRENTTKKERLFYFPIRRDTLIQMLPLNLQEKYRFLRETARNTTTSSQYESSDQQQAKFGDKLQNGSESIPPSSNILSNAHIIHQTSRPIEQRMSLSTSRNSSSYGG